MGCVRRAYPRVGDAVRTGLLSIYDYHSEIYYKEVDSIQKRLTSDLALEMMYNYYRFTLSRGIDISFDEFRILHALTLYYALEDSNRYKNIKRELRAVLDDAVRLNLFDTEPRLKKFFDFLNTDIGVDYINLIKNEKGFKRKLELSVAMTLAYIEGNYKNERMYAGVDVESFRNEFTNWWRYHGSVDELDRLLNTYLKYEGRLTGSIEKLFNSKLAWTIGLTGLSVYEFIDKLNDYSRVALSIKNVATGTQIEGVLKPFWERSFNFDDYTTLYISNFMRDLNKFIEGKEYVDMLAGEIGSTALTGFIMKGAVKTFELLGFLFSLTPHGRLTRIALTLANFIDKSFLVFLGSQIFIEWQLDGIIQKIARENKPDFLRSGIDYVGNVPVDKFNELVIALYNRAVNKPVIVSGKEYWSSLTNEEIIDLLTGLPESVFHSLMLKVAFWRFKEKYKEILKGRLLEAKKNFRSKLMKFRSDYSCDDLSDEYTKSEYEEKASELANSLLEVDTSKLMLNSFVYEGAFYKNPIALANQIKNYEKALDFDIRLKVNQPFSREVYLNRIDNPPAPVRVVANLNANSYEYKYEDGRRLYFTKSCVQSFGYQSRFGPFVSLDEAGNHLFSYNFTTTFSTYKRSYVNVSANATKPFPNGKLYDMLLHDKLSNIVAYKSGRFVKLKLRFGDITRTVKTSLEDLAGLSISFSKTNQIDKTPYYRLFSLSINDYVSNVYETSINRGGSTISLYKQGYFFYQAYLDYNRDYEYKALSSIDYVLNSFTFEELNNNELASTIYSLRWSYYNYAIPQQRQILQAIVYYLKILKASKKELEPFIDKAISSIKTFLHEANYRIVIRTYRYKVFQLSTTTYEDENVNRYNEPLKEFELEREQVIPLTYDDLDYLVEDFNPYKYTDDDPATELPFPDLVPDLDDFNVYCLEPIS